MVEIPSCGLTPFGRVANDELSDKLIDKRRGATLPHVLNGRVRSNQFSTPTVAIWPGGNGSESNCQRIHSLESEPAVEIGSFGVSRNHLDQSPPSKRGHKMISPSIFCTA
jgi:hypothetical protein